MKKKLLIGFVALGMAVSAHAAQITGGISMAGGPISTDSGDLATANVITSFGTVRTSGAGTGSYSTVPDSTSVTAIGFTFDPFAPPANNVWTFVFSGATYSFDLLSIVSLSQGVNFVGLQFLSIEGMGTLHKTGFDDTAGAYVLTANSASGTFAFSSSNGALVPDGGMTIAMLGIALTGLALIRRKINI